MPWNIPAQPPAVYTATLDWYLDPNHRYLPSIIAHQKPLLFILVLLPRSRQVAIVDVIIVQLPIMLPPLPIPSFGLAVRHRIPYIDLHIIRMLIIRRIQQSNTIN